MSHTICPYGEAVRTARGEHEHCDRACNSSAPGETHQLVIGQRLREADDNHHVSAQKEEPAGDAPSAVPVPKQSPLDVDSDNILIKSQSWWKTLVSGMK